jgi:hypothetical protein
MNWKEEITLKNQWCTNRGCQVAMATKFCTVVPHYGTCCMSPTGLLEFRGGFSSFFIRDPLLKTVVYVESLWLNENFYENPLKKKNELFFGAEMKYKF